MKFVHLSDLHVGKIVNEISLIEEQRHVFLQILKSIKDIKPNGVIIAGDIYDKSMPSAQAVEVLDEFFTSLSQLNTPVFIISGNHDSPERLGFGSRLIEDKNIFIYSIFSGGLKKHTLEDEHGKVNVYLLPFVKPAVVRPFYEEEITTYENAVETVIKHAGINKAERNLLVAHQFITGSGVQPSRSDSENVSVGGVDNIDASVFKDFDYVALGHLHTPQHVGRKTVRYCGSPYKYSFSECRKEKSVTVVELLEKGNVEISLVPLVPQKDLREIKGKLSELTDESVYTQTNTQDYMHVTLTDEEEIMDPLGKLRRIYPNLMKLDFQNARTKRNQTIKAAKEIEQKSKPELFAQFYQLQNNKQPSQQEMSIVEEIFTALEGKA